MSILLLLHVTIPKLKKNFEITKIGKIGFPSEMGHFGRVYTDIYTCVRVYLNEKMLCVHSINHYGLHYSLSPLQNLTIVQFSASKFV